MSQTTYGKALPTDHEALVDFINYVFSHAHSPTNFPTLLPKLYKPENIVAAHHYVAKEDGQIKALVGVYPMTGRVAGETLKIFGIGAVSVHPYARSKGYMKRLMTDICSDMQAQGMDLGCLGGLKHRYEYFGFTPCGTELGANCTIDNVRHCLGRDFSSAILFKEVTDRNAEDMAVIADMHIRKKFYIERPLSHLFDIMKSWGNRIYTLWQQDILIGYMGTSQDHGSIAEFYLTGTTPLPAMIAAYLKQFGRDSVHIPFSAHETGILQALNPFAENINISAAYSFNILNFLTVTRAFLRLKSEITRLPDGKIIIGIQGYGTLRISITDGKPDVSLTDEKPDYILDKLDAARLFFSPVSAFSAGAMENDFLARRLFPMPLYLESNDKI